MYNPTAYAQYKDLPIFSDLIGQRGIPGTGLFPNDRFIKGVAKNIAKDFSQVQSAAGAPGAITDLHTLSVPAGSLKINDFFEVVYGGFFAANNNDKNLIADFDSQSSETTGFFDVDDLGWRFSITYGVVSTTTIAYTMGLNAGLVQADSTPTVVGGFGGRSIARGGLLTVANIDSNAMVLKVKGQGTALGDVTKRVAVINLTRF